MVFVSVLTVKCTEHFTGLSEYSVVMLLISEYPLSFTGAVFCPIISLRSSSVCAEHPQEVTEVFSVKECTLGGARGAWGSAPSSA